MTAVDSPPPAEATTEQQASGSSFYAAEAGTLASVHSITQ